MKRALVVSGGLHRNNFALGAIHCLVIDNRVDFDLYCGASGGAIVCAHMAMYAGDERSQCMHDLTALFGELDGRRSWYRRVLLDRFCARGGLVKKIIDEKIHVERLANSGKQLRIGAVSLTRGEYKVFDQYDLDIVNAVKAASAFTNPEYFDGQLWSDCEIKPITPLKVALHRGMDEVYCVTLDRNSTKRAFTMFSSAPAVSDKIISDDIKISQMHNELVAAGVSEQKRFVRIVHVSSNSVTTPTFMSGYGAMVDALNVSNA